MIKENVDPSLKLSLVEDGIFEHLSDLVSASVNSNYSLVDVFFHDPDDSSNTLRISFSSPLTEKHDTTIQMGNEISHIQLDLTESTEVISRKLFQFMATWNQGSVELLKKVAVKISENKTSEQIAADKTAIEERAEKATLRVVPINDRMAPRGPGGIIKGRLGFNWGGCVETAGTYATIFGGTATLATGGNVGIGLGLAVGFFGGGVLACTITYGRIMWYPY